MHLFLKRLLQLGGGDGDILERAEYIGELQADEPDIFILHHRMMSSAVYFPTLTTPFQNTCPHYRIPP